MAIERARAVVSDGAVAGAGYQARRGSYSVRVWEVATGKETATYNRHGDLVLTAANMPNGQLVATGGGGKYEIELWDPKTGTVVHRSSTGGERVLCK